MSKAFTSEEKIKLATTFGALFEVYTPDYPYVMRSRLGKTRDFSITICQLNGDNDKKITFTTVYRYRSDMEEYHEHFGDLRQTIDEMQEIFADYSSRIVDDYQRKLDALKDDIATVEICENGMDNITMFEGFDKDSRYCTGVHYNTKHPYIIIDNEYATMQSYLISVFGTELTKRYIEMNSYNDVIIINMSRKEYDSREGKIDDILSKYHV